MKKTFIILALASLQPLAGMEPPTLQEKKQLSDEEQQQLNTQLMSAIPTLPYFELERLEKIKYLLEQGADVNARTTRGETPLIRSGWNTPSICTLLIEHGANVNAHCRSRQTALTSCCFTNRADICKILLDNGADVTWNRYEGIADLHGESPLSWAIKSNALEFIATILRTSIFKPSQDTIALCAKKTFTILKCLKLNGMPKDLRCLICSYMIDSDIAYVMISRKLHGKYVASTYNDAMADVLYQGTIAQLKQMLTKCGIGSDWARALEGKLSEPIKQNIQARLAQPKLLCNGTVTLNVKNLTSNKKCTIQ